MNAHRGRLQAQGGGVEESEQWAQDAPPTRSDGLAMLERLKRKLTAGQLKQRERAFEQAAGFAERAAANGGHFATISENRGRSLPWPGAFAWIWKFARELPCPDADEEEVRDD